MDLSTLGGGGNTSSMALDLSASDITWFPKDGNQSSPRFEPTLTVRDVAIQAFQTVALLDVAIPDGFSAIIKMVQVERMQNMYVTLGLTIDGLTRVNAKVTTSSDNGWTLLGSGPSSGVGKQEAIENILCHNRIVVSATPEQFSSYSGAKMTYILIKD
ncbi:hypothetical protein [Shewanella frigidimarina]|uniref:hypothetical protein n=1 Tax=Shewanella frigidimarina TaxID=56812 RepID=UPI003D7B49D7